MENVTSVVCLFVWMLYIQVNNFSVMAKAISASHATLNYHHLEYLRVFKDV